MPDQHPNDPADAIETATLPELMPAAVESAGGPPPNGAVSDIEPIIEALIFASPEPLTPKAMVKLIDDSSLETVKAAVEAIRGRFDRDGRGLQLVEVAGGYEIVTRPELHEWVRRLFHERTTQKLSVAALETLAVIAYKQPITAAEIAEIRGVNTAGVLGTLIDRKLIKIAGRKAVVGRPFMYATTIEFLDRFGLRDLQDLPRVEDLADALGFEPPSGLGDSGATGSLPFDTVESETPPANEPEAEAQND